MLVVRGPLSDCAVVMIHKLMIVLVASARINVPKFQSIYTYLAHFVRRRPVLAKIRCFSHGGKGFDRVENFVFALDAGKL